MDFLNFERPNTSIYFQCAFNGGQSVSDRRIYERYRAVFLLSDHAKFSTAEDNGLRTPVGKIFDCGLEPGTGLGQ